MTEELVATKCDVCDGRGKIRFPGETLAERCDGCNGKGVIWKIPEKKEDSDEE